MSVTPQVLGQDGPRLNCLIEGEHQVFQVTVDHNWVVSDLKKEGCWSSHSGIVEGERH